MDLTIKTNSDNDFRIYEGSKLWVEYNVHRRVQFMADGTGTINNDKIELKSKVRWWWMLHMGNKRIDILKNDEVVGEIVYRYFRGIHIYLQDSNKVKHHFKLRVRGLMSTKIQLKDEQGRVIFKLKSSFKILKLKNEIKVHLEEHSYDPEFLM